jgi:TPR repeat protein
MRYWGNVKGLLIYFVLITTAQAQWTSSPELQTAIAAYADKDYAKARQLFAPLAQSGNVFAQFGLAKMYRFAQGGEQDAVKAVLFYRQAADQQYGVAQSHLGEMYEQGVGVTKDLNQALAWYQKACNNACSEGCLHYQRLQDWLEF